MPVKEGRVSLSQSMVLVIQVSMLHIVYNVHPNSSLFFSTPILPQTPLRPEFQLRFCQNSHLLICGKEKGSRSQYCFCCRSGQDTGFRGQPRRTLAHRFRESSCKAATLVLQADEITGSSFPCFLHFLF